ncbi:hypothetical protein H4J57_19260 [Colwellia sp. BRX8-7]|jgi:hypothetical protein|uniref:hypothetical protein n=1 Tax=unclassified Colwellia TaxID=196834 RepID=UPI0015F5A982|nr:MULTISPECIES: hypothetical protein [unclassified Colwellia]MBA6339326.1 hypothetical protein [Colwellia sp. BRX8-7]MBA6346599.1 hypothetical protein [Colwellia sp. BRX8-9]
MYKKVLITALIKGLIKKSFIILVLPCSAVYCVNLYFDSFTITYFTGLFLLSLVVYFLLRPNIKHKKSLKKMNSIGCLTGGHTERDLDVDLFKDWEKGVGLIDDQQYFMWVSASIAGLEILLTSDSIKGSYIIPWANIQMLKHQHFYFDDNPVALIEIGFANNSLQLFTPWRESFTKLVPDVVGLS